MNTYSYKPYYKYYLISTISGIIKQCYVSMSVKLSDIVDSQRSINFVLILVKIINKVIFFLKLARITSASSS